MMRYEVAWLGKWILSAINSKLAYAIGSPKHMPQSGRSPPLSQVPLRCPGSLMIKLIAGFKVGIKVVDGIGHHHGVFLAGQEPATGHKFRIEAVGYPAAGRQWRDWSPDCRSHPKFHPRRHPSLPHLLRRESPAGFARILLDPVRSAKVHGHIAHKVLHQLIHHIVHRIAHIEHRDKNGSGHGERKDGQEQASPLAKRIAERKQDRAGNPTEPVGVAVEEVAFWRIDSPGR